MKRISLFFACTIGCAQAMTHEKPAEPTIEDRIAAEIKNIELFFKPHDNTRLYLAAAATALAVTGAGLLYKNKNSQKKKAVFADAESQCLLAIPPYLHNKADVSCQTDTPTLRDNEAGTAGDRVHANEWSQPEARWPRYKNTLQALPRNAWHVVKATPGALYTGIKSMPSAVGGAAKATTGAAAVGLLYVWNQERPFIVENIVGVAAGRVIKYLKDFILGNKASSVQEQTLKNFGSYVSAKTDLKQIMISEEKQSYMPISFTVLNPSIEQDAKKCIDVFTENALRVAAFIQYYNAKVGNNDGVGKKIIRSVCLESLIELITKVEAMHDPVAQLTTLAEDGEHTIFDVFKNNFIQTIALFMTHGI